MHKISNQIKENNLELVLQWAQEDDTKLQGLSSCLEFSIRRLQFLELIHKQAKMDAIQFSQTHFSKFSKVHMNDIKSLMMYLVRPATSEESEKTIKTMYEELHDLFLNDYCRLHGTPKHSLLHASTMVGTMSLPDLQKMAKLKRNEDWTTMERLPVEVTLPREFKLHSVFICPVSKDNTTPSNPPKLLRCGHAISNASLQDLSKQFTSKFKCPYCPSE